MWLELFERWKIAISSFARLQWLYGALFTALIFFGGLINLLNHRVGNDILQASLYVVIIFAANFLANAVLVSLFGVPKRPATRRATTRNQ